MAEDAAHKATLYFLEVLMNSPVPLTIGQLAVHFTYRTFTPEMRHACGNNEIGLKKFLLKYPSLFLVDGNSVSQNDGTVSSDGNTPHENSPARTLVDVSAETEAVNYFRDKLSKKREMWVPIKSVAGHLSQASEVVRNCVGPQAEFSKWLLKHPLIFDLKGENVSLKRNEYVKMLKEVPVRKTLRSNTAELPTKSVRLSGDFSCSATTSPLLGFKDKKCRPQSLHVPKDNNVDDSDSSSSRSSNSKSGPIPMTANEYKSVMFIKNTLEDVGSIKYAKLLTQIPENLKTSIGETAAELINFIKAHGSIFISNGDEVVLKRNARLNVIITGSRPMEPVVEPAQTTGKGMVYHVTKLWAIIDLGKHEHVFIDRQIFGRDGFDLTQLMAIGEMVCFNAVAAQKGSRAKWRATQVWKEDESIEELLDRVAAKLNINLDKPSVEQPSTPLGNIDEQIRKIIPEFDSDFATPDQSFADAVPSAAGVIPVWNFQNEIEMLEKVRDMSLDDSYDSDSPAISMTMITERQFMNQSVLNDSPTILSPDAVKSPPGSAAVVAPMLSEMPSSPLPRANKTAPVSSPCCNCNNNVKKTEEVGCQTVVTGEILATQLFHNLNTI